MSQAEKKLIEKQIDYQLKSVADQVKKSRGYIPGEIKGYIDEFKICRDSLTNIGELI